MLYHTNKYTIKYGNNICRTAYIYWPHTYLYVNYNRIRICEPYIPHFNTLIRTMGFFVL